MGERLMASQVHTDVPGNVWKVLVAAGDNVKTGDVLFILEVMKTEVPHEAPVDGTVSAVHLTEGAEGVEEGVLAVEIA
jgi:biotin carboxyl carrier protein